MKEQVHENKMLHTSESISPHCEEDSISLNYARQHPPPKHKGFEVLMESNANDANLFFDEILGFYVSPCYFAKRWRYTNFRFVAVGKYRPFAPLKLK